MKFVSPVKISWLLQLCMVSLYAQQKLQKCHPLNFEFKASSEPENPFLASFSATVAGPDGSTLNLPGFYDANATYNAYYYTNTAWDVMHTTDIPKGYHYLKYFSNFFTATKYWLLQPADSLVSNGYCLANAGKEYVVYQDKPAPFSLQVAGAFQSLKAQWFQPFTGKYTDAGIIENGTITFMPPTAFVTGPVVLYISSKGRR